MKYVRTIVEAGRLLKTVTQRISEALHVSPMSVLLNRNGAFRVAGAAGYGTAPQTTFAESSATVRRLKDEQQPVRVYFDDLDGWIDREVGGDYCDFIKLPNGKLGIAIGDVSGKGIGAALMMANLEASLRSQVSTMRNMPELIKKVNKMVYKGASVRTGSGQRLCCRTEELA